MKDSSFREIVEKELRKNGDYSILQGAMFAPLVKKTIVEKKPSGKSTYTWLDAEGGILAQCEEEKPGTPPLPRIGKVETINKRAEYLRSYGKTTRQFHLRLTDHDKDIIDRLEQCQNVQGYIKSLIRQDMEKESGEQE